MSLLISIIAVCLLLSVPTQAQAQEDFYNVSFCSRMEGETEARRIHLPRRADLYPRGL